jgi:hypothetical protein
VNAILRRRLARPTLLVLTVALLAVALHRGVALLTAEPLLALANNYDMIRIQGCIDAYPVRAPGIPPTAGSGDAPIARYRFRDDVGAPCFASSEALFAFVARPLFAAEAARSGDGTFSIRWLGLVKFTAFFILVAGFSIAWWLRGQTAAAAANAAVAAIVLTDPAITLYLSGFYAEFAAVLFLYAAIAGTTFLLGGRRPELPALSLLALATALLVATKIQHIGLGLVLAAAVAPAAWRTAGGRRVVASLAAGAAAGLVFQAVNLNRSDNDVMRLVNRTSTVLTSLLPLADDPHRTAEALGLPRHCGDAAGVNWYLPPISEDRNRHPCPEVGAVSHLRLLALAAAEPALLVRFLDGGFDNIRPWIPSTYQGKPHLGVVAGEMQAPLPDGWSSFSRLLDRLSPWLLRVVIAAPLAAVLLLALRRAGPPPLAAALTALAALPLPVMFAVVLGNGFEDAAKQMHLVFALVLSFWLLSMLTAADALATRLRGAAAAD